MDNPYAPPTALVDDIITVDAELIPAGRGTRLGAAMLDNVVLSAMIYLPFLAGSALFSGMGAEAAVGLGGLLGAVGFAIWAFFTVKYVRANGQSFGKRALNIKVVRANGTPVSISRLVFLRNGLNSLFSVIPLIGFVYGLADALMIFRDDRRCLHDRLADTIVILA